MTHNDLDAWRKRAPWFIFGFCILPWFVIRSSNFEQLKFSNEIIVPAAALVAAFFYIGFDLRRTRWKIEMDAYVGMQIRNALLDMIPKDLGVTEAERQRLSEKEVFRELTGVFWEAVDGSEVLRSHKEHFYSNGIIYSTSIDVYLICGFAGFVYALASLVTRTPNLAYIGAFFVLVALASRISITPSRRARHLELSAEQLDLLRREQLDFVSDRFRKIVISWRETHPVV